MPNPQYPKLPTSPKGAATPPRPTQRTIAQLAGISVGAVSRALAGDPLIKAQTRELVRQIADDIGYAPDRAAQQLRTGRSHVLGLILPPHDEILGFGTSLVRGISTALQDTPFQLVILPEFDRAKDPVARLKDVVRNGQMDGLMFSRTAPDDARVRYLLSVDFPFVCHGRTALREPHPYVDFDNHAFALQAARDLMSRGARRIALLLPPENLTFHAHLAAGFAAALAQANHVSVARIDATLDDDAPGIVDAITACLRGDNPPDGLILPGETSGLAALAALQDMGLLPGRDVHLVVKQTSGMFGLIRPRVPSLSEDLTAAGALLAQSLLGRLAGRGINELQHIQPVRLN